MWRSRDPDLTAYGLPGRRRRSTVLAAIAVAAAIAAGLFVGRETAPGAQSGPVLELAPTPADPAALELRARLSAVVASLDAVRKRKRAALAAPARPDAQARHAAALARAYRKGVAELEPVGPDAGGEARRIVAAMRRAAVGYDRLAAAARAGDRRGFRRAAVDIADAEGRLGELVGTTS